MSSSLAGAEMMTFLAPASTCSLALAASVKRPVDSMHDVDAEVAPRQLGRVALLEDLDGLAVDDDLVAGDLHLVRQAAEDACRTSAGGRASRCRSGR